MTVAALCLLAAVAHGKEKKMIDRQLVEDMFADIRVKTKWKIDGPMLWGYFFTDTDRKKLLVAAAALEKMGYRYVDILEPTSQDDDQKTLSLHVEREEMHTVESLNVRNLELSRFAEQFHLGNYDGMDVGPIPEKKAGEQATTGNDGKASLPSAEPEARRP